MISNSKTKKAIFYSSIILYMLITFFTSPISRFISRSGLHYKLSLSIPAIITRGTVTIPYLFILACILSSIIGIFFVIPKLNGNTKKLFLYGGLISMALVIINLIMAMIYALSLGGDAFFSLFAIPAFIIVGIIITTISNLVLIKIFRV
jgi:Na+/H+-translocating membrane pyrophosphatase